MFQRPLCIVILQVIENHSKQQEKQRQDDAGASELEEREEEDANEEEVEEEEEEESTPEVSFASEPSPLSDGRLVKSLSEAPIGSPKGKLTSVARFSFLGLALLLSISPSLSINQQTDKQTNKQMYASGEVTDATINFLTVSSLHPLLLYTIFPLPLPLL